MVCKRFEKAALFQFLGCIFDFGFSLPASAGKEEEMDARPIFFEDGSRWRVAIPLHRYLGSTSSASGSTASVGLFCAEDGRLFFRKKDGSLDFYKKLPEQVQPQRVEQYITHNRGWTYPHQSSMCSERSLVVLVNRERLGEEFLTPEEIKKATQEREAARLRQEDEDRKKARWEGVKKDIRVVLGYPNPDYQKLLDEYFSIHPEDRIYLPEKEMPAEKAWHFLEEEGFDPFGVLHLRLREKRPQTIFEVVPEEFMEEASIMLSAQHPDYEQCAAIDLVEIRGILFVIDWDTLDRDFKLRCHFQLPLNQQEKEQLVVILRSYSLWGDENDAKKKLAAALAALQHLENLNV